MNSKLEIIGVEDGNVVYIYNGFSYLNNSLNCTVQSISSLRKVSIEILPGKRNITWVLAVLIFRQNFKWNPWLLMLFDIILDQPPTRLYSWLVQW